MHPIILHDLTKAHTSDLHRQAERDALSRAARRARRARQAPAQHSAPFMPAHTTAELIRPCSPCSAPAGPRKRPDRRGTHQLSALPRRASPASGPCRAACYRNQRAARPASIRPEGATLRVISDNKLRESPIEAHLTIVFASWSSAAGSKTA